jgi:hypothetical protein
MFLLGTRSRITFSKIYYEVKYDSNIQDILRLKCTSYKIKQIDFVKDVELRYNQLCLCIMGHHITYNMYYGTPYYLHYNIHKIFKM